MNEGQIEQVELLTDEESMAATIAMRSKLDSSGLKNVNRQTMVGIAGRLLEMIKECLFEASFCHRHPLFDAQELKYVWISELRFWSIWDGSLTGKFENLVAFLTQADALEQEAVLLAL